MSKLLIPTVGVLSTLPGFAVMAMESAVDSGTWFLVLSTSAIVFGTLMVAWWAATAVFGDPGGSTDDS